MKRLGVVSAKSDEIALIGISEYYGKILTAYRTNSLLQGLKDFLKSRLSAYKVPKRLFTVDDFPRSPAGKLLKRKLRESFLKGDELV